MEDLKLSIENLHEDVREIRKEVQSIDKILAINTASLEEHHKRTTLSEERLNIVEKYIQKQVWTIKVLSGVAISIWGLIKILDQLPSMSIFKFLVQFINK